jgi:hypothetical protein
MGNVDVDVPYRSHLAGGFGCIGYRSGPPQDQPVLGEEQSLVRSAGSGNVVGVVAAVCSRLHAFVTRAAGERATLRI